jgi:hypothetical protein
MPEFPKRQSGIARLAYTMLRGYYQHFDDFPNINRTRLMLKIRECQDAINMQADAVSAFRIASENKNEKLRSLIAIMKNCIKKAIVDTATSPEKLKLIGWEPKTACQPAQIPGQPTDLVAIHKQDGIVDLNWKKPSDGRIVYNYIIERRCLDTNQSDNWTLEAISYGCRITISNQPKGIKLEYRVRASNLAGQSVPSNTATITL